MQSGDLLPLHAALQAKELWKAIEAILEKWVPSNALGFFLNIPDVEKPQVCFSDHSALSRMDQKTFGRWIGESPLIPYLLANPGVRIIRARDHTPKEEAWLNHPYYLEFLAPLDWRFPIGLAFWEQGRLMAFLSCFRKTAAGDFTGADEQRLRTLHPHLEVALKRIFRVQEERALRLTMEKQLREQNAPVLLLDSLLRPILVTRSAKHFLKLWQPEPDQEDALESVGLPQSLLSVVRRVNALRFSAREGTVDGEVLPYSETILHPTNPGLQVRVQTLPLGREALAAPLILIQLQSQQADPPAPATAGPARTVFLSAREQEIVALVCQGLSNQEIADRMEISLGTVKRHLNAIFAKMNVPSRSRLMAMLR